MMFIHKVLLLALAALSTARIQNPKGSRRRMQALRGKKQDTTFKVPKKCEDMDSSTLFYGEALLDDKLDKCREYWLEVTPSASPSLSLAPVEAPAPTQSPVEPTSSPSLTPLVEPSASPSVSPSTKPTESPTASPTAIPTIKASTSPSSEPSSTHSQCKYGLDFTKICFIYSIVRLSNLDFIDIKPQAVFHLVRLQITLLHLHQFHPNQHLLNE